MIKTKLRRPFRRPPPLAELGIGGGEAWSLDILFHSTIFLIIAK